MKLTIDLDEVETEKVTEKQIRESLEALDFEFLPYWVLTIQSITEQ